MRFVLASASPRRRELLTAAGYEFDVEPADVDETPSDGEQALDYVTRVARAKADAVGRRYPDRVVLAADTEVVVDGRVFGKPRDAADAARMLRALAGRTHQVVTAVALYVGRTFRSGAGGAEAPPYVLTDTVTTEVTMSPLTDDEISAYVLSGEPMDKAGAYAIQGLASRFIPRIHGSYTNVVGLPIDAVARLLRLS